MYFLRNSERLILWSQLLFKELLARCIPALFHSSELFDTPSVHGYASDETEVHA